jgi:hypothetical protein
VERTGIEPVTSGLQSREGGETGEDGRRRDPADLAQQSRNLGCGHGMAVNRFPNVLAFSWRQDFV